MIYDSRVQADLAVELGADDETLEFPWEAANARVRYYDLKRRPDLLFQVEEAQRVRELGEFLATINSPSSLLESAKCDAWLSAEMNPEEEIFGATCKFGSYVDLVFSEEKARFSLPQHKQLAKGLTELLKRAPEIPAAADFLVRRGFYHHPAGIREGFYITFYLFGYGNDEPHAQQQWAIALKLVLNAMRQVARDSSTPKG